MTALRVFAAGVCFALAGCGTTPEERGISGAGIGASAGAILGAVTGLSVLEGAVIGATAGGLTGALTNKNQVNLGEPAWKRGGASRVHSSSSATHAMASNPMVQRIQSGLTRLGYDAGPADGIVGWKTRGAIRSYQEDHRLLIDGVPTPELAAHVEEKIGTY